MPEPPASRLDVPASCPDAASLRAAIEAAAPGICVERGFVIQFANAAFARTFGYPGPEDLLGVDVRTLIAPEDRARMATAVHDPERGLSVPARLDLRGRTRAGAPLWLDATAAATRWGDAPAVVRTVLDVSERRRLEEQLVRAQKIEAVGRLAGGVAHDFNNLLTVILGRADLLLQGTAGPEQRRRDLELIYTTAARGATLVQQLMAFARRDVLEARSVDLNETLRQLTPLLRHLLGEAVEMAVVPAPEPAWVRADPSQLEQVVVNLVVNARDAMPEGGRVALEVGTTVFDAGAAALRPGIAAGPHVILTVSDTGTGMDEATRRRIFEPFFTTKPPGKGTGLGLATVFSIVRRAQGWVEVDSTPGQGSCFRVVLPQGVAGPAPAAGAAPAPTPAGSGTVLVVEDDEGVRLMTVDALRLSGYAVLEAAEPDEALVAAAEHAGPIDLAVTDVIMPGMNGLALVEQLRLLHPGLQALYISGYGEDLGALRGLLAAGAPFLHKPFTISALAGAVAVILGRREPTGPA